MPCHRARRRGLLMAAALVLSLALPLAARPTPAAAQAPGLQLVVEQPTAGSDALETIVIGGWAVDTTSSSGTGIGPDGVEIWLGPADSGQLLGTAGYGDPRPEIADRLGNQRYLASGFRYFWNSCDAPPGPNTLTVRATSSAAGNRTTAVSVPITVNACSMDLGDSVTGQVFTAGPGDSWTFDGTAGERVAITLDGVNGWDTLLELIAPDGSREDVDDDGGYDLNSWLSRHLNQTGRYTVIARPFSNEGCTGDYVVMGWMGPPERSDPNSAAAALGTAAQFTYRASLREFGERQAWTFTGEQGNELILYLPRNVGSRLDPFIELQGPDGQVLARDDDSGGGLNSFLQGVLPQGGTYTLNVFSARDDCGGEYRLSVERDWGAQSRLRGDLAVGDTTSGSLDLDTRRDVWSFPATAGERMTFTLNTNGPTRLQIAAPDGSWEQTRSTRGRPLGLSFEPAQTGTYQAVVFVDSSRPVDYDMTLERGFGRLVNEKGPAALGQPISGEIVYAEGRDLYTFQGRQGQQVRIALDRPGRSQLDPYLELRDPTGRTIAEDDDSGGDLNSLIQIALPSTGQYTIVAHGVGDTAGPYVLTVTLSGEGGPSTGPSPTPGPGGPSPAGPSPTTPSGPGPAPSDPGTTPNGPGTVPNGPGIAPGPGPSPSGPGIAPGPGPAPSGPGNSPSQEPTPRPTVPPTGPPPSGPGR
ncbi:MAG TPA: PPC domain-containing protein [Chloroflexota bacterium]|nr:PPC domain-containing protein [Chloroflexota bacterium]